MNITGKLIDVMDEQQVTTSFKKREFVVEYAENPQYPESIKFEMIQDKCPQLDVFNIGQEINVHFNLKGRKWTDPNGVDKYFNTLQAWKVESKTGATPEAVENKVETSVDKSNDPVDDLPF